MNVGYVRGKKMHMIQSESLEKYDCNVAQKCFYT